ncbi:hypothetical protein PF586_04210 [Lactobacillus delbrueckii]|uniref:GAF domain-containing protein n=2 Tax=Lactobacillus delbrueckii TaxID=1584 RepID=A0AAW5YUI5_9LACO|nr:hypothetical protein [Lactobacillus delbrueckii]TXG07834.1 hypothetical protein FU323_05160 [Lactobacillus delbrueckii subsp. bulgaricus]APP02980.1 hypothetical protein LI610_05150 [Lactobacillus delbrueckii subsp. indicus]KNE30476.1 hypothetical protein LDI10_05310 [Lactobacillus delbrueckii subsp. indicus]KRL77722.1 hypothetical protein FC09_GL001572 [Lactobacillus delbrueckii subsp. indicus DSM 15996]MCT2878056.1 hypothetical protein [Lactobacillus delbrueckii]
MTGDTSAREADFAEQGDFCAKNDIDRILLVPVKNDFGEIQAYLLLTNVYDKGEINPVSLLQHLAPVFSKIKARKKESRW